MGTVTDPATGAALGGINVLAYDSTGDFVTGTTTDANGKYMLVGLPGGSYGVGFSDPNGARLTRYFHDARSLEAATPVLVTAGQPSTADQALPLAGKIAGTVTSGGSPLGDVEVTVYDANDTAVAIAFTSSSDGSYAVGGLETGTYHVGFTSFSGQLLPQYFDGEPTLAKADPVTVTAGTTATGVDADLVAGPTAQITGTVTGAPPSGVDRRGVSRGLERAVGLGLHRRQRQLHAGGAGPGDVPRRLLRQRPRHPVLRPEALAGPGRPDHARARRLGDRQRLARARRGDQRDGEGRRGQPGVGGGGDGVRRRGQRGRLRRNGRDRDLHDDPAPARRLRGRVRRRRVRLAVLLGQGFDRHRHPGRRRVGCDDDRGRHARHERRRRRRPGPSPAW